MSKSERRFLALLGIGLIAASVVLFAVNYAIFRDAHDLFFYLIHGLALVPLEVLIVGVVLERLISVREKRSLQHKLNMVIGAFFSELGSPLLAELLPAMKESPRIREELGLKASWKKEDFARARQFAQHCETKVDLKAIDRDALRAHLLSKRTFILGLLENPNLMEHQRFTDLIWAVLHLEEELEARISLAELLPSDEAHLEIDARRAFAALLGEWLVYVEHLKADYPYLFSLVVRTHPFQEAPSIVVTG
jgi:hypothetical protein